MNTVADLADGILLNRVMNAVYVKGIHQVILISTCVVVTQLNTQ